MIKEFRQAFDELTIGDHVFVTTSSAVGFAEYVGTVAAISGKMFTVTPPDCNKPATACWTSISPLPKKHRISSVLFTSDDPDDVSAFTDAIEMYAATRVEMLKAHQIALKQLTSEWIVGSIDRINGGHQ